MLFPEGTRSPDGRLYRGKTGVARIALEAGVPVVPIGVIGTFELWPYTRKMPKSGRVTSASASRSGSTGSTNRPPTGSCSGPMTDEIMYEIMMLTGQEYVDEYGDRVKKELEARAKQPLAGSKRSEGPPEDVVSIPEPPGDEEASAATTASSAERVADRGTGLLTVGNAVHADRGTRRLL